MSQTQTKREQVDAAAFGVVYGSITVMALLMSMHRPVEDAGRTALVLFGSVFAVATAKSYAELCEQMLRSGKAAGIEDFRDVWAHSRTVLLAANGPALAFGLAAFGVYSADTAHLIAQVLAFALLVFYGARIGWRASASILSAFAGAAVTGGLGLLVSALKYLAH